MKRMLYGLVGVLVVSTLNARSSSTIWADFERIERHMGKMMTHMEDRFSQLMHEDVSHAEMQLDVTQVDSSIVISVKMPGISADEDVAIETENDIVTARARYADGTVELQVDESQVLLCAQKEAQASKAGDTKKTGFYSQSVTQRSISLPHRIDVDSVQAEVDEDEDLLLLSFDKKEARKIEVQKKQKASTMKPTTHMQDDDLEAMLEEDK